MNCDIVWPMFEILHHNNPNINDETPTNQQTYTMSLDQSIFFAFNWNAEASLKVILIQTSQTLVVWWTGTGKARGVASWLGMGDRYKGNKNEKYGKRYVFH